MFEKITKKRTVKYFLFLPILFFLLMPRAPKPLLLNLILNNITFFFCNCAVSNFLMISGTKSRGQKFKFGLWTSFRRKQFLDDDQAWLDCQVQVHQIRTKCRTSHCLINSTGQIGVWLFSSGTPGFSHFRNGYSKNKKIFKL